MKELKPRWMPLFAFTFAVLLLGCGESAMPGTATISLTTPNTDDGALLITVTGPSFTNVQSASSSYQVFSRLATGQELRLIVVGNLAAGPVATVDVADVNGLSVYTATISQVSDRLDELRESLSGYSIDVVPPGGTASNRVGGISGPGN